MTDQGGQLSGTTEAIANVGGAPVVLKDWPRLLSVELAAAYLGTTPKTIRNHRCKLPGMRKMGSRVVFDRKALDAWIDRSGGKRDLWLDAERLCQ